MAIDPTASPGSLMTTDPFAATAEADKPATRMIDMRQLGGQGLMQSAGFITEDLQRELHGLRGVKTYAEMTTDATCAAILNVYINLVRQAPRRVDAASSAPYDREAADFLESCLDDMEDTWSNFVGEALPTMLTYGHAPYELVYKRRGGENALPYLDSHYADGRVGWRAFASRHPSTVQRWLFDDNGRLLGMEQQCPPKYRLVSIPYDKMMLFRTNTIKGSPEGVSIFRGCYRSYLLKKGIENLEGVGLERDSVGVPVARVPRQLLEDAENGDQAARRIVDAFRKITVNLRNDAQAGLVLPAESDESGKPLFDISLMQSAGSRQFDSDKIIRRHATDILKVCGADFLGLGDSGTGSFAMHSDKVRLFLRQANTYLKLFTEELNNRAVRKLMRLNGFRMSDIPRVSFGSLDQVDLSSLADALQKLAASGMPLFPDKELEDYIRESASLPVQTTGADSTEVHPQDPEHLGHVRDLLSEEDTLPQTPLTDEEDNLFR